MTPIAVLVAASILAWASGVPMLFSFVPARAGQLFATVCLCLSSIMGIGGALFVLLGHSASARALHWAFPFGEPLLNLDALAAVFPFVISLVSGACAIYARGYWKAEENPGTVRRLTFFFGVLTASLLMVVLSQNGILLVFWWEVMSFAAYFCLITEHTKAEVREAGSLYLIVSHVSVLGLFALFAILNDATGSFLFPAAGSLDATSGVALGGFAVSLLAFGLKAGVMPLHIWLPSAHASAPSHVSAMLSGVVLKVGIYGLVRTLSFFSNIPLWWGVLVLILGVISGVIGVAFAIAQHDLKRLLAYHSIENIGIILMGIGVALLGQHVGHNAIVMLGMAGALLHVVNHATFKALLFLGAGSVIHAAGTRTIDILGGIQRKMPWTAAFFLAGAIAICGLPPLNGFVSELLIYVGLLRGVIASNALAAMMMGAAAPALALIGGLAVACFVKVYGVTFLGAPRSDAAARAHEAPYVMLFSMAILAAVCFTVGLVPWLAAPLVQTAVESLRPALVESLNLSDMAGLGWVSCGAIALLAVIMLATAGLRRMRVSLPVKTGPTWGCGYTAVTARMQYTASSFGEMFVGLFRLVLRPHVDRSLLHGICPDKAHFKSHVPETTLEHVFVPLLQRLYAKTAVIRDLQHGHLQIYIVYVFVTLFVLLVGTKP